jgi:septal ring factor EnvC (AmiA/AmiB activator)
VFRIPNLCLHIFLAGSSSSLAAASSELEILRASHKTLEAKLAEAEKSLAEKKSELIRKEGEFQLKRRTDSETIQAQQKELGGLRKYMETAEGCWDLLNSDFMGMSSKLIE